MGILKGKILVLIIDREFYYFLQSGLQSVGEFFS